MKAHLLYLWYVLRHKWYVFVECWRSGIPWLGVMHDLSKFMPSEWFPYVHYFYNPDGSPKQRRDDTGYYKPTDTGDAAFDFAWLLHQKRNRHHWQWWILPEDEGKIKVLPIPAKYRLEMLADWRGAARTQGLSRDSVKDWYQINKDKMMLEPVSRAYIVGMLWVTP